MKTITMRCSWCKLTWHNVGTKKESTGLGRLLPASSHADALDLWHRAMHRLSHPLDQISESGRHPHVPEVVEPGEPFACETCKQEARNRGK